VLYFSLFAGDCLTALCPVKDLFMQHKLTCFIFITILLFFIGCSSEPEKKLPEKQQKLAAAPALPVEVVIVKKEKVPVWLEYTGKTEASKRIEVRARVSGTLEEVLFKEGEYIEKGQKLFTVEKASYEAAVTQTQAKLEGDQASMKLALADEERYKPLVAEGLAPRITLEQYQVRVMELTAMIKADQAAVKNAELNLSYTDILAPISGRISRINIDVGNIVGYAEKTLLTTMVADDPMYAYFNPNEEQYQLVRQYKSKEVLDARVTVPNKYEKLLDRKPFRGVVDFNDNRVDKMTGTITMRAKIANPEHNLLEGTFVYVNLFVTDQAEFLMVNPGVVQEDQQDSFVYVVDENGLAKRVNIVRGFETRNYMAVTKGLEGGEKVIWSGLAKIRPGVKITPTDVTETKGIIAVLKEQDMIPEKE